MKRGLVFGAAVALTAAAAYGGSAATRPDPAQAVADGCVGPAWAYVNASTGKTPPQWVKGVVDGGPKPSLPKRRPFDFTLDVEPDPAYSFLLAGGVDLPVARELRAWPSFAWPELGNRVELLGSWVWNCGLSTPDAELHPFRALWLRRALSARSPWGEAEGDLFLSTDSTPAGVIADCALKAAGDQAAYDACLPTEPAWQDVGGAYRFVLPAPPKPPGAGRLSVRVVDRGSVGGVAPTATIQNGAAVVTLKVAATPGVRLVVAAQVFLGWTGRPAVELPQHLRVSFRSLVVRDGSGPWNAYWNVAGAWGAYPAARTVDVYLPRGKAWRFLFYPSSGSAGIIAHRFASPVASLGLHHDDPVGHRYELTYVVTRVNDALQRAAAQPR